MQLSLVLLPGLDGTGVLFKPLLKELPPEIRPIVVPLPNEPLGYRELLPVVISRLPKDEPFVLLGESFSGPLAVMIAAAAPANLRAVVLAATFVRNPLAPLPASIRHLVTTAGVRRFPRTAGVKALLLNRATPALLDLLAGARGLTPPEVIASRVHSALTVNVVPELLSCRVPILYLHARHDFVVPGQNLRFILHHRPDVTAVSFPSPHMLLQVEPKSAWQAMESFFKSLPRP